MASSRILSHTPHKDFTRELPRTETLGPLDRDLTNTARVAGLEDPIARLSWGWRGPSPCAVLDSCQLPALQCHRTSLPLPVQLVNLQAPRPKEECTKNEQQCQPRNMPSYLDFQASQEGTGV